MAIATLLTALTAPAGAAATGAGDSSASLHGTTPGWNGQTRQVRQPDGVHLNTASASIAADLVIRQLRRDGFVG